MPVLLRIAALAIMLLCSCIGHGQGCSQCRDNLAEAPARTRAGYRHAILLLTLTATAIFASSAIIVRRRR